MNETGRPMATQKLNRGEKNRNMVRNTSPRPRTPLSTSMVRRSLTMDAESRVTDRVTPAGARSRSCSRNVVSRSITRSVSSARVLVMSNRAARWPLNNTLISSRSNRSVMVAMSPRRSSPPWSPATITRSRKAATERRSSAKRTITSPSSVSTRPEGRSWLWRSIRVAISARLKPWRRRVSEASSIRIWRSEKPLISTCPRPASFMRFFTSSA